MSVIFAAESGGTNPLMDTFVSNKFLQLYLKQYLRPEKSLNKSLVNPLPFCANTFD